MDKTTALDQTGLKPKILLVEDNDENKDVTKLILKDHFMVSSASDGHTAITKATNEKYSAVLMDIKLGRGMDGTEVKKQLRLLPCYHDVPIIAITAYALRGDRDKYLQQGFDSYLAKPFSREDLVNVVFDAISMKHVEE
ncbi:MAG: response regulator [Balneolales bacterium]